MPGIPRTITARNRSEPYLYIPDARLRLGDASSASAGRRIEVPPTAIPLAVATASYDWGPVAWKLLIVGGGWVSWESKPARLRSSSPGLAGHIRSASLPREGRPLVRLDDEQGAFALARQVLDELGLRAEVG